MKRKNLISALLVAGFLVGSPLTVDAAGMGKLRLNSALGQPLRAEIELISIPKDEIDLVTAKIAPAETYKQQRLERQEGLGAIRFTVEKRPGGEPYLKLSSTQAFNEPFLQLLIQLDWPTGRLLREYTVLLDPPGFKEPAIVTPAIVAPTVSAKPEAKVETKPESKSEVAVSPAAEKPEVMEKPAKAKKEAKKEAKAKDTGPAKEKAEKTKKSAKKQSKDTPLVKAEPVQQQTPAEQTFPKFDGEEQQAVAPSIEPATPILKAQAPKEYVVQKGDTLAKIARENQVEGYSLEQMMVALYATNKSAFDGNNLNRIKTGKTLNIPDQAALEAAGSTKAAAKEVRAHAADWNAYRQKLAGAVAEQKPEKTESTADSGGKITAKAEDKAAKAQEPAKDVLKLSKGETAGKGDGGKGAADAKALKEKLAAAQDDAVAKQKALQDANSRISELDKNIKNMEKLLELKNKQLAELEKQAKAKPGSAPAPAAKVEPPKVEPPKVEPPKAEPAKAEPPKAEPPKVESPKAEPAKVEPPKAEVKPEAPKPPKKPKVVPPPAPETSFLDSILSNPLYLGGGAAAIVGALFAGLWALGRKRKKSLASFEDSIMTGGDLKTNTVFGNTAGGQIDTGDTSFLTDFSQAGMGAIDTNDVDPIAEAEVYMAYGRDAQAEEILKEAMSKDPSRHEVQLKLLEIYAGRKNTGAFETLAGELYAATNNGQSPVWKKAAELGRSLDPANPLYADAGDGAEGQDMVAMAGGAAATSMAQEIDFNLDMDTQGGKSEAPEPAMHAASMEEGMEEKASDALEGALDFDLDTIGGMTPAASVEAAAPAAPAQSAIDDMGALDFNIDTIIPQAVEKKAEEPELMPDLGLDNLRFDAPETPAEAPAVAAEKAATAEEDTLALDFDFNLDQDTVMPQAAEPEEAPMMPELDLSGINLNLEEPAGGAPESGTALDDATTMVGENTVWEEVSTKLDLAKAYLEMGDKEGAREILQEVAGEGGAEQKEEANKLLATLA